MVGGGKSKKSLPSLAVEFDREEDERWIAEVPKLPGVVAYGNTKQEAQRKVFAIALRTLADNLEQGSRLTPFSQLFVHEVANH